MEFVCVVGIWLIVSVDGVVCVLVLSYYKEFVDVFNVGGCAVCVGMLMGSCVWLGDLVVDGELLCCYRGVLSGGFG